MTTAQPPAQQQPSRPALIGPWSAGALACFRSWRLLGLRPVFLHLGDRALTPHPGLPLHRLPANILDSPEGAARVAALLRQEGAAGVTALTAPIMRAALRRADTLGGTCDLWLPQPAALAVAVSRGRQIQLAREVGLDVPATFAVRMDATAVPAARFPVVVRSDDPAAAPTVCLRRPSALAALLAHRAAPVPPLLVQPLLSGPLVIVHGCRDRSGTPFALEAFLAPRTFRGQPLSLRHTTLPPALAARCAALADAWDATGPFRMTFLRADGTDWFLGLAPGLGASGAMAWRLGYDAPRHLLTAYGALPRPRAAPPPETGKAVARGRILRHAAALLAGRTTPLDQPARRPLRALAADAADLVTGLGAALDITDLRGSLAGPRGADD